MYIHILSMLFPSRYVFSNKHIGFGLILYFRIPEKVRSVLDDNINNIKKQIDDAEKLKEEAKMILSEYEKKISNSKSEIKSMINNANIEAEKNTLRKPRKIVEPE